MFDISFLEIVVIAVIALLVLGPDKLPGAIRTAGLWIGRLKRSFNNIRSEIEREVGADEIRRQLRNEAIMDKIKNTRSQVTQSIDSVKEEVKSVSDSANIKKEMDNLNQTFNPGSSDSTAGSDTGQPGTAGSDAAGSDTAVPDKSTEPAQENRIGAGQPQEQKPEQARGNPAGGDTPEPTPRPATGTSDSGHNSNNAGPDDKQRT